MNDAMTRLRDVLLARGEISHLLMMRRDVARHLVVDAAFGRFEARFSRRFTGSCPFSLFMAYRNKIIMYACLLDSRRR